MKRLLTSAVFLMAFALPAADAGPVYTGLGSLWAYGKERGQQDLAKVVGVVGFYGQDQPRQWMLLSVDPRMPGLMHEFVIRDGRVVAERHFQRPTDQDLPSIPLPVGSLRVDSHQAFKIAESTARRAGLGFDSLHYQLRCRDLRNEPVWVLNLIDQKKSIVGVLYVSALNGEVLRSHWHPPGTQYYTEADDDGFLGKVKDKVSSLGDRIFNRKKKKAAPVPTAMVSNQPIPRQPHPAPRQ